MKRNLLRLLMLVFALPLIWVLIQHDVEPDPLLVSWQEQLNAQPVSDSYYYLMGIAVDAHKSPLEEGKRIAAQCDESRLCDTGQDLAVPDAVDLLYATDCDGEIKLPAREDVAQLVADNAVLLSRVEQFYAMQPYHEHIDANGFTFPPYQYLVRAERIRTLQAYARGANGEPEAAGEMLAQQLMQARGLLRQQSLLIGKMVLTAVVNEKVNAMAYLMSSGNVASEAIAFPAREEISFRQLAKGESVISRNLLAGDRMEFSAGQGLFEQWMFINLFHANRTVNAQIPVYQQAVEMSEWEVSQFANQVMAEFDVETPTRDWLLNPLGSYYGEVSLIDYVARLKDLESKLIIFNRLVDAEWQDTAIVNPYGESFGFYRESGQLCFDGPMVMQGEGRCLPVGQAL